MKVKFYLPIILLLIVVLSIFYNKYSHHLTPYGENSRTGKYIQVNGINMYFETYGVGEPLLMIHPNGGSIKSMQLQIEYFKKNYRVIAADSRGHGKSELKTDSLTYRMIAKDCYELLNVLTEESVNVLGWSDGGIISLILASNHPNKINKVIAIGANLRPDSTALEPHIVAQLRTTWHKSSKDQVSNKDNLEKQLLEMLVFQPHISHFELNKIKTPVMIMAGENDWVKHEHSLEIHNEIPNSKFVIIEGGSHFIPVQQPKKVNEIIKEFLLN